MRCPSCDADDDKVIDSRASENGDAIRRRRECNRCGRRFTTYERVEKTARLVVVKKDGSRVPFDNDNVMKGVQAACGKRPIPEEAKTRVVREVEEELHRDFEREVASAEVGRRVAAKLRDVDHIAYIRFASEYHDFRTLEEFQREVAHLQDRPTVLPNQAPLFGDPGR
ncbi:MAG: transcriptional regulator NrdR [Phycisphaerales bacterium]